jgi:hypothetical protein
MSGGTIRALPVFVSVREEEGMVSELFSAMTVLRQRSLPAMKQADRIGGSARFHMAPSLLASVLLISFAWYGHLLSPSFKF